ILTLCHPFDYLRWMLGEVDSLFALTASSASLGLPVEDAAEVVLNFSRGLIASVHLNYVQQPPVHTLEVVGSEGTLRWEYASGLLSIFHQDKRDWQTYSPPEDFDRNRMFMDEMSDFLATARGAALDYCNLEDGIHALEIALAARQSGIDGTPKQLVNRRPG
ncbi:MAG TPA: Gfo/Idh/MocA family oxidoreductase, partial [Levilinea sp.]|nr:Gfo/Idh/MocA family oxidoreductase [Levilinea sp.]